MLARQSITELRDRSEARRHICNIILIGLGSGLLYLAVYFIQRAIYGNGLSLDIAGVFERGEPADRETLLCQIALYCGAHVGLFGLYAWLLLLCRAGRPISARARNLALLFPVLFNLGLLFGRPYLSIDLFSYMAHGYLGTLPTGNPYLQAARDIVDMPLGPRLVLWGWRPEHGITPYGPLWTQWEIAVMRLTPHVSPAILLLKSIVVLASFGTAALIWNILGRVRPESQLLGTLIYLWNPMIIVEFASEGHNDALMIFFVLAALACCAGRRPVPALVSLGLGTLAKYLPLILLPAHLVYVWRTRASRAKVIWQIGVGVLISLAIALVLYWPLWAGARTFTGVLQSGRPTFLASTSGVLFAILVQSRSETDAAWLTSTVLSGIFGLYLLGASLMVRDARTLLRACGGVALVYLLVASPGYWPWYAAMPVALMALTPGPIFVGMIFVLSFCSRLTAPIDTITVNGFTTWTVEFLSTTVIGVTVPLLVLLGLLGLFALRPQWRRGASGPQGSI